MMKIALHLNVIVLLVALTGCASKQTVKPASPVMVGKPASMDTILVTASSALFDLTNETNLLSDSIYSGLNESKMFASVTQDKSVANSGGGIKISAEIRQIKKVSDNAREWSGALAGQAWVLVRVTVSDLRSGSPIEVFEVVGRSGQSAFAGTTNEAIIRAAQQVVAEVFKLNAQIGS
jgi:hypothetical protein